VEKGKEAYLLFPLYEGKALERRKVLGEAGDMMPATGKQGKSALLPGY